jgi:hypothetical protein
MFFWDLLSWKPRMMMRVNFFAGLSVFGHKTVRERMEQLQQRAGEL